MKFNEAVKKHKNNLIENLSKFHEGHRVNGMLRDIDSSSSDYEYYFKAGAASRQAEIDELQKRIDDALDYVFGLYCTGDLDTERLENILKGESNE